VDVDLAGTVDSRKGATGFVFFPIWYSCHLGFKVAKKCNY
jgi:hypothetical protein